MATPSSTLALKISWTEELGAGYYPWGRKESGMALRGSGMAKLGYSIERKHSLYQHPAPHIQYNHTYTSMY